MTRKLSLRKVQDRVSSVEGVVTVGHLVDHAWSLGFKEILLVPEIIWFEIKLKEGVD